MSLDGAVTSHGAVILLGRGVDMIIIILDVSQVKHSLTSEQSTFNEDFNRELTTYFLIVASPL